MLKGCGGACVDDVVDLMLHKLMTDDLAELHNFRGKGKGGKAAFISYSQINEAIFGMCCFNNKFYCI